MTVHSLVIRTGAGAGAGAAAAAEAAAPAGRKRSERRCDSGHTRAKHVRCGRSARRPASELIGDRTAISAGGGPVLCLRGGTRRVAWLRPLSVRPGGAQLRASSASSPPRRSPPLATAQRLVGCAGGERPNGADRALSLCARRSLSVCLSAKGPAGSLSADRKQQTLARAHSAARAPLLWRSPPLTTSAAAPVLCDCEHRGAWPHKDAIISKRWDSGTVLASVSLDPSREKVV